MLWNKEIKRVNSKEETNDVKHEDILTGEPDIHLPLWILTFCLKYHQLKLYTPTLARNKLLSINMDACQSRTPKTFVWLSKYYDYTWKSKLIKLQIKEKPSRLNL